MYIHELLFGQLYPWAGEFRDVNIAKGGNHFGDHASMPMYLRQAERYLVQHPLDAEHLGELHTHLNFAHPFREGNGRTLRVFFQVLCPAGVERGVSRHVPGSVRSIPRSVSPPGDLPPSPGRLTSIKGVPRCGERTPENADQLAASSRRTSAAPE
ncbi:Fic family protein [Corynebacterium sp.]|uniref:Fic family protein n=1 Tax=Corynebacterium sp. TaxID=1720 RepID=UPI0034CF0028